MASSEQPSSPLADGFSFLPGELIPTAPYVFPGEAELFMFLELTAAYAGYIPVWGTFIALIAEIVELILDLIDELVSIFTGKPRAQDTITVAKRFAHGSNFTSHLVATQLHRNLSQNNIVLSSSDPADQKVLGDIRKQAEAMLVAQGATAARATKVIGQVWGQTTSATEPLPAELTQAIPSGLVITGPQTLSTIYTTAYNKAITAGDDPQQAAKKATDALLNTGKMGDLGKLLIQPQPLPNLPQPPPTPTPPPPPTEPPEPQPTPCPPYSLLPDCFPLPPTPDDSLDEVGDLAQMSAWGSTIIAIAILNVYQAILGQSSGQGEQTDPVTCTQITNLFQPMVAAIASLSTVINNYIANPPPSPTAPVVNVTVQPSPVVIEPGGGATVDLSILNAEAASALAARTETGANILALDADWQIKNAAYGVQP